MTIKDEDFDKIVRLVEQVDTDNNNNALTVDTIRQIKAVLSQYFTVIEVPTK